MRTPARFIAAVLAAAVLLGPAVAVTAPAAALGCVLGPSLESAARAAGVSCPQIDGGSGAEHWGAAGGACSFGWESSNLPPGLLDFLRDNAVSRSTFADADGVVYSSSVFRRRGKVTGSVSIATRPDRTFRMLVDVYGRASSSSHESVFFDCKASQNGPMYRYSPVREPVVMSPPGSQTISSGSSDVSAGGSMTALGKNDYLLRVDATNTGTDPNMVDFELDLAGYRVTGFPTVPKGMTFQPDDGLICLLDEILPGQTVTVVLVLRPDGSHDAGAVIDVAVSSRGLVEASSHIGAAVVRHRSVVTDFYSILRP